MCIEYRPFLDLVMNIRSVCVLGVFFLTTTYVCPPPIVWLASSLKCSANLMEVIQSLIITLPFFMSVLRSTPNHKLLKDECRIFLKGN